MRSFGHDPLSLMVVDLNGLAMTIRWSMPPGRLIAACSRVPACIPGYMSDLVKGPSELCHSSMLEYSVIRFRIGNRFAASCGLRVMFIPS